MRALKSHGGVAKADLNQPNLEAVKAGASNLIRHIDNLKNGFGLPVVVADECSVWHNGFYGSLYHRSRHKHGNPEIGRASCRERV